MDENIFSLVINKERNNNYIFYISYQDYEFNKLLPYETSIGDIKSSSHPELFRDPFILFVRGDYPAKNSVKINVTVEDIFTIERLLFKFSKDNDLQFRICRDKNTELVFDIIKTDIIKKVKRLTQADIENIMNETKPCHICNGMYNNDDLITYSGQMSIKGESSYNANVLLCKECAKLINRCHTCSKRILGDPFITPRGREIYLCLWCPRDIIKCSNCNINDMYTLMNPITKIDEFGDNDSNDILCEDCLTSNYNKCNLLCGMTYDSNIYTKCPCQYPTNFKWGILSHNEDVLNHYNPDYYTKELFGIEVEVGTKRTNRLFIEEILAHTKKLTRGNAILKWDASIDYLDGSNKEELNDYCGFEIVTRPMAYKSAKEFIEKLANNRHRLLRCWEVGTTGIHIHVNKKYLRPIEIGKILLFMNAATNRDFIIALAKRNEKKYAKFLKRSIFNFGDSSPSCHYHAVNTSKPNTIEFRVFRGTLNKNTMVSYLQFVKSLIEFVKVAPIGGTPPYVSTRKNQLTYKQYVDWLFTTNRSQYRELKSRICNEDMKTIIDRGEI